MLKMKSRLATEDEKQLYQLLGNVKLHLLYKASYHGFDSDTFRHKCGNEGPTLTIGFNPSGCIFGGYTHESFPMYGSLVDNHAFLFRINSSKKKPLKFPVTKDADALCNSQKGPNFGASLIFLTNQKKITINLSQSYIFEKGDLCRNDMDLQECEIYRVEALNTPWRNITWTTEKRTELLKFIENYKPLASSVSEARVLFVGPTGSGKSSFINSANSVFRGHVTCRTLAGSSTTKYATYTIKAGRDGLYLPFILCDSMGVEESKGLGIVAGDITKIIEGHVPEKYQFNSSSPIVPETAGYINSPTVSEKIHCVVLVIDSSKVANLSIKVEERIRGIQSEFNNLGIPQVVLLTKVDKECPMVLNNLENIYRSEHIEKKVLEIGERFGIPISCIIPVKNYSSELELDCKVDILILSALVQMLRYADDYFENLED
uniref:Interferon-induced protein 44-like protein n=2 Tax=Callorhinchus milii TaxID=7868 RepID=V9KSK7_CALMI